MEPEHSITQGRKNTLKRAIRKAEINSQLAKAGLIGAKAGEALAKSLRKSKNLIIYETLDNFISLVMQKLTQDFDNQREREELLFLKKELILLKGKLQRRYDF